jgi:protein AroM
MVHQDITGQVQRQHILGLVTIGQTPRPDLEALYGKYVPGARIRMVGALDAMGPEDIRAVASSSRGYPLSTMLGDGSRLEISLHALAPLVEKRIRELHRDGVRTVMVLCCGEFLPVDLPMTIIYPSRVVPALLLALRGPCRVGIILPNEGQMEPAAEHWTRKGFTVHVASAPSHDPARIGDAARTLAEHRPDMIVLDCMGFGEEERRVASSAVSCPVIVPAFMTARIVSEFMPGPP